ncbi:hypothetical protein ACHAW5_011040 [Stephanodiscus triporus]|uniref:Uncharacterized protein n=1 Tax=Stephanodiscus triporus TaxID=2934178 RepID=A0ABD3P8K6_9STRA
MLSMKYHGISNPSPGYVQRVSQAFISGSFSSGGKTFGNNEYGNLKAVAAAITLDPESSTPVVDAYHVSGNIREPFLKVMQILRSLSFQRSPYAKLRHGLFDNMSYKIGQIVFYPPDHFSTRVRANVYELNSWLAPEVGDYSTAAGVLAFPYQTNDVFGVSNKIDELYAMITL